MPINRHAFFDSVRGGLFGGALDPSQVNGMNTLLDTWEADVANTDDHWLAYMLGTAFHETARTMQPIREDGGEAYFIKRYDVQGDDPDRAIAHGNAEPGDGPKYCGRGYVQLTWKDNYKAMSTVTGADLVGDPDMAMQPAIAAKIMVHGMKAGSFTSKKLSDYFRPDLVDWRNARRIINGLDCAEIIEGYGKAFHNAIILQA